MLQANGAADGKTKLVDEELKTLQNILERIKHLTYEVRKNNCVCQSIRPLVQFY